MDSHTNNGDGELGKSVILVPLQDMRTPILQPPKCGFLFPMNAKGDEERYPVTVEIRSA
jgi:hypothetical protein